MAKRNKPKTFGGVGGGQANMMQQFQRVQAQMEEMQHQLSEETVTASVGGGALKIVMTGDQHCISVAIDPELLKDADAEMLQDLFVSGINAALDQSRDMQSQRLGPLAGGLSGLPF